MFCKNTNIKLFTTVVLTNSIFKNKDLLFWLPVFSSIEVGGTVPPHTYYEEKMN